MKILFHSKNNLFLILSQVLLFLGTGFIGIYFLPNCIYPYGETIVKDEKALFGDLTVYISINEYGLVDFSDYSMLESPVYDIAHLYVLPDDDSFLERIKNIKGIKSVLKRQIPHTDYTNNLKKIDKETGRYIELFDCGRYVGYDFSELNNFYSTQEAPNFDDVSSINHSAILFRENMVQELEERGISLQKGDVIEITSGRKIGRAIYCGSFEPIDRDADMITPEAVIPSGYGFILNSVAFGELWNHSYYYKSYTEPPSDLKDIILPGLVEGYLEKLQYESMGYNQLLIRLEKGANKEKLKNQIQDIVNEYNKDGSVFSLVVDDPIHNYYNEEVIRSLTISKFASTLMTSIILVCAFVIGIVGIIVFIMNESSVLSLYHILGRRRLLLTFDILKNLFYVCFLPYIAGGTLAVINLFLSYPGRYIVREIIIASCIYTATVSLAFSVMAFIVINIILRKVSYGGNIV